MSAFRRFWVGSLVAGAMAFSAQAALGWRLGADLHALLGSVLIATLIASPKGRVVASFREWALLLIAIPIGIALAWLLPPTRDVLSASIVFQCLAVLFAWTFCIGGMSRMIGRILAEPTLGSAATTVLALAWLTAPIWLGTHAATIVKFHPLFAMNVPLIELGLWTEQTFEYRYLFSLGQDVPYVLPPSIVLCCMLHGLVGLLSSASGFSPLVLDRVQKQAD